MRACVHTVFGSELTKVRDVLLDIVSWAKRIFPYISDDDLNDLKLIYSELLVNAVIHGNKEDGSKKVELMIEVWQDDILSVVRDEGQGFDYTLMLSRDESPYSEKGRGLTLVSSLTEMLNFNEQGNEIKFIKRIIRQTGTAATA